MCLCSVPLCAGFALAAVRSSAGPAARLLGTGHRWEHPSDLYRSCCQYSHMASLMLLTKAVLSSCSWCNYIFSVIDNEQTDLFSWRFLLALRITPIHTAWFADGEIFTSVNLESLLSLKLLLMSPRAKELWDSPQRNRGEGGCWPRSCVPLMICQRAPWMWYQAHWAVCFLSVRPAEQGDAMLEKGEFHCCCPAQKACPSHWCDAAFNVRPSGFVLYLPFISPCISQEVLNPYFIFCK